jgi:hypothetical protein
MPPHGRSSKFDSLGGHMGVCMRTSTVEFTERELTAIGKHGANKHPWPKAHLHSQWPGVSIHLPVLSPAFRTLSRSFCVNNN